MIHSIGKRKWTSEPAPTPTPTPYWSIKAFGNVVVGRLKLEFMDKKEAQKSKISGTPPRPPSCKGLAPLVILASLLYLASLVVSQPLIKS